MFHVIETQRLKLINCNTELLKKIIEGDDVLSLYLQVQVPDHWNAFGIPQFEYSLNKILNRESDAPWWGYLMILKSENSLIGNGGFKGPPDAEGMVEIGYEVALNYRNQGYATEMAQALTQHAFVHKEVRLVRAHTLAEENASGKVLKNCGLKWVEQIFDPEDGKLWRWEIRK